MRALIDALINAQDAVVNLPEKQWEAIGKEAQVIIESLLIKAIKANGENPADYEIKEAK